MYKNFLLPILFSCLCATLSLAQSNDPPRIPRATIGNWNNYMDPNGCVHLDGEEQALKILARITLATNDMNSFPTMYLYADFTGQSLTNYGPITGAAMVQEYLQSGHTIYVFTAGVFEDDFVQECTNDPNQAIAFDYDISIRDASGNIYPLSSYPALLTPEHSTQPERTGEIIIATTNYNGTKDLCCYQPQSGGQGLVHNTNSVMQTEQSDKGTTASKDSLNLSSNSGNEQLSFKEIAVSPNPFNETLKISFETIGTEATTIQVWDVKGQLVYQAENFSASGGFQEVQINTAALEKGCYYCTIKNSTFSRTVKVLKL